ncbi:unnamed protein product [Lactuca saligna]|uniref:Uncharacterized protein n=1 Tax=Lactuca saligna TaxID=75948 RepID=A0AA35Z204_LACSI|nr:unnamed protein product [Lactuca saligna]
MVESFDSEEEDNEDKDGESTNIEEEDVEIEVDELVTKIQDIVQRMNSSLGMNKHIQFSSTYLSTRYEGNVTQHGSIPTLVVIVEPLILDEMFLRIVFPSPQAMNFPPISTLIQTSTSYQWESSSTFNKTILY